MKLDQEGQPGRKQFLKLDNVIFIVAELLFELRKVVKRIYDAKRVLRFITLHIKYHDPIKAKRKW